MSKIIQKKKIDNIGTLILEYLIWIFIILDFNTVFLYNGGTHYYTLIASGLILFSLCTKQRLRIPKNALLYIAIYLCYMILWNILAYKLYFNAEFVERFLVFMPLIWIYIYNIKDLETFLRKFSNIIIVLAVLSLIFWSLGTIMKLLDTPYLSKMYWGFDNNRYVTVKNYFNLYFETSHNYEIFGINTARNDGIFCEGPMYAAVLVLAQAYEFFYSKTLNIKRIVILTIATITTISLTGWILVLFMYIYKFISKRENTSSKLMVKVVVGFIVVCLGIYAVYYIFEMKTSTDSFMIRLDDYIAGFNSWKTSVIWGHGYGNSAYAKSLISSFRSDNTGASNSVTVVLSQGGIMWLLFYVAGFISYFKIAKKYKNWSYYGFLIVFLMMFLTVVFHTRLMILVLLSIGFSYDIKKVRIDN